MVLHYMYSIIAVATRVCWLSFEVSIYCLCIVISCHQFSLANNSSNFLLVFLYNDYIW